MHKRYKILSILTAFLFSIASCDPVFAVTKTPAKDITTSGLSHKLSGAADVQSALTLVDNFPAWITGISWGGITGTLLNQTDLQTALGLLVPKTTTVNGYALSGNVSLGKSDVGLGNVENTSDLGKPISAAAQAALNLKYDVSNPSGYLSAPVQRASVNWSSLSGDINSAGINWTNINKLAPIQAGGVNWSDITLGELQRAGMNWTSVHAADIPPLSYVSAESDPVYSASSWYSTANNASNWDDAYSWGNHANAGYLTTESDPYSIHQDQSSQQSFTAGTVSGTGMLIVTSGKLGLDTNIYALAKNSPATKTIIFDGDYRGQYQFSSVKKLAYQENGAGITIIGITVKSSTSPTTQLNANLMYCDAQTTVFPSTNPTSIASINTTAGAFDSGVVSYSVATGKPLYVLLTPTRLTSA